LQHDHFEYDAFISYRRSDGAAAARWLRTRLQSYTMPKPLRGERPKKLKIYLDTVYERATEDFFELNIKPSLERSRFLLIVSTPDALRARPDGTPNWVHREVETFSHLPQGRNLLVALAKGEMSQPLPGDLAERFPRIEIVDFRQFGPSRLVWWPKLWRLREELLKIVAPLFDVPLESMPLLRLEESRRRQRSLWLTLLSSFALFAIMTGLFIWALINLASARQQLIRIHLLQGQDLFAGSPAHARLHFAKAVEIADSSSSVRFVRWLEGLGVLDLGLRSDYEKARLWLGQWKGRPPPQVVWHRLDVRAVDFSPDGRRFATVSVDGEAQAWDVATGRPVGKRMSVWPYASFLKFSPDGRRIVVVSTTTFVTRLWDAETGEPVGQELMHTGPVTSASFSPDGRVLATASGLGQIFFWDTETAEPAGETLNVGDDARRIAFSPDGRLLAVVTSDNAVRVWDYAARRPIGKALQGKRDTTNLGYVLSFNRDSRRLLVATGDSTAQVMDARTGEPLGSPLRTTGAITSATFSPDGERIVTGSFDGTAQVWAAESGAPVGGLLRHGGPVLSAAFSADGGLVVTASRDFTARVWETATGAPLGGVLQHAGSVNAAVFSPDAKRVATVSDDHTARLWEVEAAPSHVDVDGNIKSVSLSRDGAHLLIITDDKTLKVWDWPAAAPSGGANRETRDVEAAVFSTDGSHVWLKNARNEFYAWDYESGEMRNVLSAGGREFKEAQFSPDARRIITKDQDNVVNLWEAATGVAVGSPLHLKDGSDFYGSSANGEFLILLNPDESLEAWSLTGAKALGKPLKYEGELQDIWCAPDGSRVWLLTKDEKKKVSLVIWDTKGGGPGRLRELEADATFGAVSADGRRIVIKDYNYSAQVWDTQTGEPLGKALRHGQIVNETAFSPDGRLLLTVSRQRGQVWDVSTGEPLGGALNLDGNVVSTSFGAASQRLVIASSHKVFGWEFTPDDAPADTLRLTAEAATVLTIDDNGSIRMLSEEEWRKRLEQLPPR
jgi:WD40 repeat protein